MSDYAKSQGLPNSDLNLAISESYAVQNRLREGKLIEAYLQLVTLQERLVFIWNNIKRAKP